MPKIRGVKPEFWTDDIVVELSPLARLLFIGLWNYACDNGHLEDKPRQLKMRILPADDCNLSGLLDELAGHSRIIREAGWLAIPNFHHQRVDKRYFTTCDKPGCHKPDTNEAGQAQTTTGPRRGHTVTTTGPRVDGDGVNVMVRVKVKRPQTRTRRDATSTPSATNSPPASNRTAHADPPSPRNGETPRA